MSRDMTKPTKWSVRPCRSSLIRIYTVFHSVCIFMTHYFMAKQLCSNFRLITANCLGVRIFRIFMVDCHALAQFVN